MARRNHNLEDAPQKNTEAYNASGVEHVKSDSLPAAESKELGEHLRSMRGVNTDHDANEVFNPFQSDAQRKAMYAAAEGRSTLGIPKAAAKKFIKHSK